MAKSADLANGEVPPMAQKEFQQSKTNWTMQLFVLNLVTALAIGNTAYAEISRLADGTFPFLLTVSYLVSTGAFLVAAGLCVLRRRVALLATFTAALLAWPRYVLFFLGFTIWGRLGIASLFTAEGFLQILAPSLLLYFSTTYSYGALKNEPFSGPLRWLLLRSPFHRVVVIGGLIGFGIVTMANGASVETMTHRMSWRVTKPYSSPCRQRVDFTFLEASGFKVLACSDDLLNYLESLDGRIVTVTFEVSYSFGLRSDVSIVRVNQWTGDLEEGPFLHFSCRSDELDCYGSQPGSPLSWDH